MKEFLKYMFACLTALIVAGFIFIILGIIGVAGIISSESTARQVKPGSILHLSLSGSLVEQSKEDPLAELMGDDFQEIGLKDILSSISKAKDDANISGIFIESGAINIPSPAMAEEIRYALIDFKESGKFIISYADSYTQMGYYISSVSDKVILNPKGHLNWSGMASQPIFYKDLLEKIGIKMQVFKVGTYKSAIEPYTRNEMSEDNKMQVKSYLDNIWDTILEDVAESRNTDKNTLDVYADSMLILSNAEDIVRKNLADTLCYMDGVRNILAEATGNDAENLSLVSLKEMKTVMKKATKGKDKIAVYYAHGDIVDVQPDWNTHAIVGKKMCKDLKKLREDKNIKAVVVRINSGGGSAYASEQIWHEMKLLAETKPVVVSMGGMAASGGYYIACGANKIIAEPTTLTGSIGIFGMIPDASNLLKEKLGLTFDVVKTNEYSDFGTMARPFNPNESAAMQAYIQRGYSLFTARVAEGRNMKTEEVEKLAQGRVWTGKQALENKLADANGYLADAIKEAARMSNSTDYSITEYPTPEPWYSNLLKNGSDHYLNSKVRSTLGAYYEPIMQIRNMANQNPIQARLPFEPNFLN